MIGARRRRRAAPTWTVGLLVLAATVAGCGDDDRPLTAEQVDALCLQVEQIDTWVTANPPRPSLGDDDAEYLTRKQAAIGWYGDQLADLPADLPEGADHDTVSWLRERYGELAETSIDHNRAEGGRAEPLPDLDTAELDEADRLFTALDETCQTTIAPAGTTLLRTSTYHPA